MTAALRFALIGAGRIGALHAANLAATPGVRFVSVFDSDSKAAEKVAASYGAAVTSTADEIFDANQIDAVLIASPTATHVDFTLRAARAGQAVLCEKPVSLDTAEAARAAAALAEIPGARVQVGFNRRFDPGHAELARRVAGGDIGRLEQLVITSRDPGLPSMDYLRGSGGIFRDMMIHDFDLARFVLSAAAGGDNAAGAGDEADEITTVTAAATVQIEPRLRGIGDHDSAMATLTTAAGRLCHISNSRRAVYGYDQRVEAFGAAGMLVSGNRTPTEVAVYNARATAARPPLLHFFTERYAEAYRLQLAAFIEVVDAGQAGRANSKSPPSPSPSFEDGRRALVLAAAAEESLRDARAVSVQF
ncbi:MAG: Gfo/Idh/MocA family oxidoreductase [Gammaproteobacteria bacterium]|nr:Gfo/Idh/MocA family oxidoreductase [Gammaproteobacteria bacterium]